jgi:site-specific recombinase XerD
MTSRCAVKDKIMAGELTASKKRDLDITVSGMVVPAIIAGAGGEAGKRFLEFFAAQIRNANTREAYMRAVTDFFDWCDQYEIGELIDIKPLHVATWVEMKTRTYEPQTVKLQLAALRNLFDWLVTGQVLHTNPASFVRGPKYSSLKGKTPILTPDEARRLLRSIPPCVG